MVMNCPECGRPVEPGARFCPQCCYRIEPPGRWRRFLSLFSPGPPRRIVDFKKSVTIKTTDEAGQEQEYQSLDELTPALRAEIEKLEAAALKGNTDSTGTGISRTESEIYVFTDEAGNERICHSLEELPPEFRAAVEKAPKGTS